MESLNRQTEEDHDREAKSVLIVDLATQFGGAEQRVIGLSQSMLGRRDATVATISGSPLHEILVSRGLPVLSLPYRRGDPRILIALMRFLQNFDVSIVDTHNAQSHFWGALAAYLTHRERLICTVHGLYKHSIKPSFKERRDEWILRLSVNLGAQFVAVSQSIDDYLVAAIGRPDLISMIPNGIEPQTTTASKRAEIRQEFGYAEDDFIIAVIARLDPIKGHDYLFEALSEIEQCSHNIRCLVVGTGPQRDFLETLAGKLDIEHIVRFSGFRTDIPAILEAADLFCLPSHSEGLPYAMMEAAASARPMLMSDLKAYDGVLTHENEAVLFPAGDVSSLRNAIIWCRDHPEKMAAMGSRAGQLFARQFALSRMVGNTATLYDLSS